MLDSTTTLLPTQFDPSELRTDVTGKIVRFIQSDGAEVEKGKPYAEVEAMKMVMPLLASESGRVKHAVSPGSIIDAGDLIATLDLRDPGKAKKIANHSGTFTFGASVLTDDAPPATPAERYAKAEERANLLMAGYDLGDVEPIVQELLGAVCDPALAGSTYGQDRYQHALSVIAKIMNGFLAVEEEFVGRALDDTILRLTKANAANLSKVSALAQAHRALPRRSSMALSLLRQMRTLPQRCNMGPISWEDDHAALSEDLSSSLKGLARLYGIQYGEVALMASHLLAEKRLPPISERMKQLRDLLLGKATFARPWDPSPANSDDLAVRGASLRRSLSRVSSASAALLSLVLSPSQPAVGGFVLTSSPPSFLSLSPRPQSIVESPTLAVDLLPSLFEDPDMEVRTRAVETYVRRVYRAHNMLSLEVDTAPGFCKLLVKFSFQFRDTPARLSPVRYGVLALVDDLKQVDGGMGELVATLRKSIEATKPADKEFKDWVDPVNVLHVACNQQPEGSDTADQGAAYFHSKKAALEELGVKFVNLIAYKPLLLPRYYTYTSSLEYKEDHTYRGQRPTFAHLLELSRLTNYNLVRIPTVNRDLHVYVGTGNDPKIVKSQRPNHLFLRRISHSRDVGAGGLERILTKALDSLALAVLDPRASATTSSRLFVNFLPTLSDGEPTPVRALAHKPRIFGSLPCSQSAQTPALHPYISPCFSSLPFIRRPPLSRRCSRTRSASLASSPPTPRGC